MSRMIYPCTKSGKLLKGFCPCICETDKDVAETLFGWIRFREKFGIKYWFDGDKVLKLC